MFDPRWAQRPYSSRASAPILFEQLSECTLHNCTTDSRQTEPVYDFQIRMFIRWSQLPDLSTAVA
jgi:hypothetical protein